MRSITIAIVFCIPGFFISGEVKGHTPVITGPHEMYGVKGIPVFNYIFTETAGLKKVTGDDQVIAGFAPNDTRTYGDASYTLGASASSGLPVSYASSDIAVAIVSGNTVTIVGQGNTTITASQSGNAAFNAAIPVTQSLTVNRKVLSVTGTTVAPKVYDGSPIPGAITVGTISGFVGAETVTATARGVYSNANAAPTKIAGIIYTLLNGANGGLAANYVLQNSRVAGTITPAPLTITVLVDAVKCIDENITFDNSNYGVTGLVSNETIAAISLSPAGSPPYDPVGAGTHTGYIGVNALIAGPSSPTVFIPGNYTITVVRGKLTIVKPPKLVPQNGNTCSGLPFNFMPANTNGNDFLPGTTFSWQNPAGNGFSGGMAGTAQNSISGNLALDAAENTATAIYTVIPKYGNCVGDAFTLIMTIKRQLPKPSIVQSPATLPPCQYSSRNFTAGIASAEDISYQWITDAELIAVSSQNKPIGKNAVIRFPGTGTYNIRVIATVSGNGGCANDNAIIINTVVLVNTIQQIIIHNGIDFVCLNNNVDATIDGYQWGYDSRDLVPVNFTTADAPFVTAQNLARPITDTSIRYIWVITKSGSCYTKTYFNTPHGRPTVLPPPVVYQSSPVKIYPNPVTGDAVITWRYGAAADGAAITITDLAGRIVIMKLMAANSTPGRAVINLSRLQRGMYLVNINIHNKSVAVGKLLKE